MDEYDDWTYKNFGYFKEYIEQKLFHKESVEEKIQYLLQFYKQIIVYYYASSISLSVDSEGYQYSTSSLSC